MVAEKHPREEMMVRNLDMTRQALRVENQEAEWLQLCLSAVEAALTRTDREIAVAKAAAG